MNTEWASKLCSLFSNSQYRISYFLIIMACILETSACKKSGLLLQVLTTKNVTFLQLHQTHHICVRITKTFEPLTVQRLQLVPFYGPFFLRMERLLRTLSLPSVTRLLFHHLLFYGVSK